MTRIVRLLPVLLALAAVFSLGSLSIGAAATHRADSESGSPLAAQAVSEDSVRCLPFGLNGEITAEAMVDKLSDSGDGLIFLGTSNGLYVLDLAGKLRHFLYSPFGVRSVALIDDITGDASREVVVVLNDTQVPALRCYDGITWDKLWQFAPMAKVWDDQWVERQTSITSLEVIRDGSSQSVVVISGGRVFSLDARDGTENWRSGTSRSARGIAAMGDLSGDDSDEVFLATEDGYLVLLSGNTGSTLWRTRLPKISVHGEVTQSTAGYLLPLDRQAGRMTVASSDGMVRLFDLNAQELEWEVSLPTQEGGAPGPMALVPDATPDGRPGILVSYASPTPGAWGGIDIKNRVTLLDAAGGKLWDSDGAWSLHMGSYGGRRVVIVPTVEEIKLLDLADGESVVRTIPVSTPDEWGMEVRQIGEDAFLLVGSLTAISSSGEVLWHYPRIGNVRATGGHFVGDATEDTLFSAEWKKNDTYDYALAINNDGITLVTPPYGYPSQVPEPDVRLLKVMDGATGGIAWSYEVPLSDLKSVGGLKGIEMTADLVGADDVQDILAYRGDTVFVFSGRDGTSSSFPVLQPIASLETLRNGTSGNAIAAATSDGLTIFDSMGNALWATTGEEWAEDDTAKFMVLDDLNADNVSDLAVLSSARIVLLESAGSAISYQERLTFNAESNTLIEYVELVPDASGDGVRDLCYILRALATDQQSGPYAMPARPLLLQRSPVDGRELLRVVLPSFRPCIDLSCGDFDGDGYDDSLVCFDRNDTPDPPGPGEYGGLKLQIISGRDGEEVWTHFLKWQSYSWYGWNTIPPATNIGDVTGDGKIDLAWMVDYSGSEYSGYQCRQLRIEICDVAGDQSMRVVAATPLLEASLGGYGGSQCSGVVPADVDGDGRSEVIAAVFEPSRSYEGLQYLAVVNAGTGARLAAFRGFSPKSASVFQTRLPGTLGIAAAGGAYYLNTNADLRVTSPASDASTGPVVGVKWEGASEGEFAQVFVDGVLNYAGNDSGVDLYLARGRHDIVVRSIDDCGRILYGPTDLSAPVAIKVTPSPWKPVLLVLTLFVLLAMIVLLFYARLHRVWRARRRDGIRK